MNTAKRWQDRIGRGASAQSIEIDGIEHLVCSGTGDCDGGAFAYVASDVADWLDATDGTPDEAPSTDESGAALPGGYEDFCGRVDVVETAEAARAVRDALGVELYHGGSCRPVLESDDEAWSVGDHIAGGHGEDRDLGAIIAIDGDRVTVAWRWSESRTVESLSGLRSRAAAGTLLAWDGYASDDDAACNCAECVAHRKASA